MKGSHDVGNSKVGLSIGITINLGNYESARVDAWAELAVNEGEKPEDVFEKVNAMLQEQLKIRSKEMLENYK